MENTARRRRRTLAVTVGIAVVSMLAGFGAASQLRSPAEAAARAKAPEASLITAEVERRALASRIVTRGQVAYEGAVEVTLDVSGSDSPSVVTGHVPEVGATIDEGQPLLEVSGRPVIALAGELPMYRTLRPQAKGPDVLQLEEALARLGLDPGAVDGTHDASTSKALDALYERLGYEVPQPSDQEREATKSAEAAVDMAQDQLAGARQALKEASKPPTEAERLDADRMVRSAERALAAAQATGDAGAIADAQDQLAIAVAQRDERLAPRDTTTPQQAVDRAAESLADARERYDELTAKAGTPALTSEIVFLKSMPRRVDEVLVRRGDTVDGPVLRVSGADLLVTASVTAAERQLLSEGMAVTLERTEVSLSVPATVGKIQTAGEVATQGSAGDGGSGDGAPGGGDQAQQQPGTDGFVVSITPGSLTPEQVELLRGANVKVTIPVKSTEGEVLAVPLAAISAGAGGESRVEVADGRRTRTVVVEVGLTADGYAEVRPVEGSLDTGDDVVVGR